MANQILKDNRGRKIGSISQDFRGNQTINDAMNRKIGTIKQQSNGRWVAADKLGRKLAEYYPEYDKTKLPNGKMIRGNVLLDLFFSE